MQEAILVLTSTQSCLEPAYVQCDCRALHRFVIRHIRKFLSRDRQLRFRGCVGTPTSERCLSRNYVDDPEID